MIIVEFDFNKLEMKRKTIVRDWHKPDLSNFTRRMLEFLVEYRKDTSETPSIYIGLNLSSLMLKSPSFNIANYGNKISFGSSYLGNFVNNKVYLDLRINPNEVIIGEEKELFKYVLRIERRKKLKKLNKK